MHYLFLLLSESIIPKSSLGVSPNWVGAFLTTSQCNFTKCCCIYGTVQFSKEEPNYLKIQGLVDGLNCPSDKTFNDEITMPLGFRTDAELMGGIVHLILSADSRIITLDNANFPQCSGQAIRDHASSIKPTHTLFVLLAIGMIFFGK